MPQLRIDKQVERQSGSKISRRAKAVIDERKAEARPRMLDELLILARHRSTSLTGKQMEIIASLVSYMAKVDELRDEILDWMFAADIDMADINRFFDSGEWSGVLRRAQEADRGQLRKLAPASDGIATERERIAAQKSVDPRKDYAIPRVREEFEITDEEEESLNLTLLVSERRRSNLRRRAEGVPEQGKRPKNEPWRAEGISKAQYYRNRKQVTQTLDERLLATITAAAIAKPWPQTVYEDFFNTDKVAESLTAPKAPPEPYRGTAEAARLAALATELGLVWKGADLCGADWWYSVPAGTVLTEQDVAVVEAATFAAFVAERRKRDMQQAKWREQSADPRTLAKWAAEDAEREAERRRGEPPRRVSRAAWAPIPPEFRDRVQTVAGLLFLRGHPPDVGIAIGIQQVRREDAFVAALQTADPTVDTSRARALAVSFWHFPTQEAVNNARVKIAEEKAALRAAEAKVLGAIDRVDDPPVLEGERTLIISEAARALVRAPDSSPEHLVRHARDSLLHEKLRRL
jgi:hypothetical protein